MNPRGMFLALRGIGETMHYPSSAMRWNEKWNGKVEPRESAKTLVPLRDSQSRKLLFDREPTEF